MSAFKQPARAGSLNGTKPAVLPHDSLQFLVFCASFWNLLIVFYWFDWQQRRTSTYNVKKQVLFQRLPSRACSEDTSYDGAWKTRCIVVFFPLARLASSCFFYSPMLCAVESVGSSLAFPTKRLNFFSCVSHAQTKVLWPWRVSGRGLASLWGGEHLEDFCRGYNDHNMFDTSQLCCLGVQIKFMSKALHD